MRAGAVGRAGLLVLVGVTLGALAHGFFFGLAGFVGAGLVFAGANHYASSESSLDSAEDGILTAEEVATMDLSNVQLVTLSACETGLGAVAGGEGLLGLQRAFLIDEPGQRIWKLRLRIVMHLVALRLEEERPA